MIMEQEKGNKKMVRTMRPVLLTTANDQIEAEMLKDILEQNDISVLVKDPATGGYMRVYMGFSIFGQELYVDEEQYTEAKRLLNEFHAFDGEAFLAELSDSFTREPDQLLLESFTQAQETTEEEQAAHKILMTLLFVAGAALLILFGINLF